MTDQDKAKEYSQSAMEQGESNLKQALGEAEKKLKEGHDQATKWASTIDKQVHDNPWPLVAGVSVACFLLGLIIGKSKE